MHPADCDLPGDDVICLTVVLPLRQDMETTRLSSKGQLVLPKAVRDAGNWSVGTEFIVETVPEGVLLRPRPALPVTRLEDVIGCTGYRGAPRSTAEMARAIAAGVKARRARGRY